MLSVRTNMDMEAVKMTNKSEQFKRDSEYMGCAICVGATSGQS